ncbi:MAG: FtsX-like permease family protein [Saccharofermentans sp.]|nr:FtsX-like permease family protein [Saccharofermentans sp.]
MKKTLFKDALRNIKKKSVSFVSIAIISILAVMTYLGLNYAAAGIMNKANSFYDDTHFRDIEIFSTLLLTEDDLNALRSVEGVRDVEGVYETSGIASFGQTTLKTGIESLTERINTPLLIEGRLPEAANECLLETYAFDTLGVKLGDTIRLADPNNNRIKYLNGTEFTVTGLIYCPEHGCTYDILPGKRDIIVHPGAFDADELDNCYVKALISVNDTEGLNRYLDGYGDIVTATMERLQPVAAEREILRHDSIRDRYEEGISSGQADLDDAERQLSDARDELDRNRQRIIDGEAELDTARQMLEDNEQQLAEAQTELEEGRRQLDDGESQLAASRRQLEQARRRLDQAETQLNDAKRQLDAAEAQITEGRAALVSSYQEIESQKDSIRTSLYNAIHNIIGSYADDFDWSESSYNIDVDSSSATATEFHITSGIMIDFKQSMGDNIFRLISSLGIPEDDLRTAYEITTGIVLIVADGSTVVREIVDRITAEYQTYNTQYESLASSMRDWDSGHTTYINGVAEYNSRKAEYESGLARYNAGKRDYQNGLARYNAALADYQRGQAQYESGLAEYNNGVAELEDGRRRYDEGVAELEDGRTRLEEGEASYESGMAEYSDGVSRLDSAKADLAALKDCHWVILDVWANPSFNAINNNKNNVQGMAVTFALVFLLVAAMVVFATCGRIIDEQRRLVGATKALGLYNREIFFKYLLYGSTGTVLGCILGFLVGYFGLQRLILYIYGRYYVYGPGKPVIVPGITILVIVSGLVLSGLTVWIACSNLIRSTAIKLMQETVPQVHKLFSKSKKTGSLYGRLIILNMLSDKKRVAVTIASIAGCCAMLVAGMTMRYSVLKALDGQFIEIELYDQKIIYDPEMNPDAGSQMKEILDNAGASYLEFFDNEQTIRVGKKLDSMELVCADLDELGYYFIRRDLNSNEVITDNSDGLWIHRMTSERYELNPGDELTLFDNAMDAYKIKVAGIFNNYVGRHMIMSRETYKAAFGEEPSNNAFLIKLNGADGKALSDALMDVHGASELTTVDELKAMYKGYTGVLDALSALFIAIAAMMAFFILLNLVNMYINQKKRELTIMRINGFTVGEVKRYVLLELVVSTIIGILLGWGMGSLLSGRVILLMESDSIHFLRSIQWEAWIIAAALAALFSTIITLIGMRKVKNLKMVDMTT